jgi:hypothetical protein
MKSKNWVAVGAGCFFASGIAYASQTVSYTYDALGRLVGTQTQGGPGGGTTQSFQYDPAGNRKQYQSLLQVALSMNSPIVNLTSTGATLTVNLNNPSATGTVTFTDDTGKTIAGPVYVSNGRATAIVEGLSKGTYTITASYSGDGADTSQVTTFTIKVQDLSWLPAVLQLLLQ